MKETPVVFGRENSLVGVITQPEDMEISPTAVLLLNAGLNPHVGPNRLYVRLARQLSNQGLLVFRFDLSGVGDSSVRTDKMPFEEVVVDDVRQAMDTLTQVYGIEQFVFMGHCSGAALSFLIGLQEERVAGVVLMNPQNERQEWKEYDRKRKVQLYYQNYYGQKVLTDKSRWRKFLTGKSDYRSVFRNTFKDILWSKFSTSVFKIRTRIFGYSANPDVVQERIIEGLRKLGPNKMPLLFIYSSGNTGYEVLKVMLGKQFNDLMNTNQVQLRIIDGADHTFTLRKSQDHVIDVIGDWCELFTETVETPEPRLAEPDMN